MSSDAYVSRLPPVSPYVTVTVNALRVLADLRSWAATRLPRPQTLPLEAMALSAAVISPWCSADQVRPSARLCAWAYALDDYAEQDAATLTELDHLLTRCETIAETGTPDTGHPLLAALSECVAVLKRQPLYSHLAPLWVERFRKDMRGVRYDWTTARARREPAGDASCIEEYLDHADSILVWTPHLARWICHGDNQLLNHLDVLIPALDDKTVAVRLANDLATIPRERAERDQNNILMYGASPAWVRAEVSRRTDSVRSCLAPLVAAGQPTAIELLRSVEWAVGFYAVADFRDSDTDHARVPLHSEVQAT